MTFFQLADRWTMIAAVRWSVLAFVLCGSIPANAQVLRGRLIDAATGNAVAGAEVVLRAASQSIIGRATADSLGFFELRASHAGSYTIAVTHVAYLPYTSVPLPLARNEIATVTVRLSTTAIPLETLVVHARRSLAPDKLAEFERRREQGSGHFITRKEIDSRPVATATSLLRPVPGIVLQRVTRGGAIDGGERYVIQFRGPGLRPCVANVYVDGVHVAQAGGPTVDEWLDPELLAGVEVYPHAVSAPLEYRRTDCGVVLFWTREGERLGTRSAGAVRYLVAGAAAVAGIIAFVLIR